MRAPAALALSGALLLSAPALAGGKPVTIPNAIGAADAPDLEGWLDMPSDDSRVPAVVLMHGCTGLTPPVRAGLQAHATFLVEHGIAALIVDSFGPRGLGGGQVCSSVAKLGAASWYRVGDAFNSLAFLRGQAGIDGESIFLLGQSNGGTVVLNAARERGARHIGTTERFAGVIAYYPYCAGVEDPVIPILILIGSDDDWTPAASCEAAGVFDASGLIEVVIYPGAVHSFDLAIAKQLYVGHWVGGDADATEDSRERMLAFIRRGVEAHGP